VKYFGKQFENYMLASLVLSKAGLFKGKDNHIQTTLSYSISMGNGSVDGHLNRALRLAVYAFVG